MIVEKHSWRCPKQHTGDMMLCKACFHPDLLMAAMSVMGSKPFLRAYWLHGSGDAGEVPGLQSRCVSLTWGSGAHTNWHIHTSWRHTEATLPKLHVFGLLGKRQGICQMCTPTPRLVPPIIGRYGAWPASSELLTVGCYVGQPDKNTLAISV